MANGEMDPDIQPALDAVCRRSQHSDLSVQYHASPCRPEAASGENRERDGTARRDWLCGLDGQSRKRDHPGSRCEQRARVHPWYRGSVKLPAVLTAIYGAVMAGEEDLARPLNSLALSGLDVVAMSQRESRNEQENALHNGLTPVEVGPVTRYRLCVGQYVHG